MSYVTWKVEREPFADNAWGASTTLTGYHDLLVKVALGDSKDTFQFKLTNTNNDDYSNYFNINDKITLSRKLNSSTVASSDVLMVGIITNQPIDKNFNKNTITIKGVNYSETVANAIVFIDAYNQDIPTMLESAVNSISNFNSNFAITWDSTNPSLKQDNSTSFPTVNEKFFYKPFRTIIEKYSSNETTGDGNYYWYVNSANKLVWKPRTTTVNYNFDYNTDSYRQFKVQKDTSAVKNYLIMKGGHTPKGKIIQTYVPDWESIAKHGIKYYYHEGMANKTGTLLANDKENVYFVDDMADATYPLSISPPWSSGATINSYAEYEAAFKTYMLDELKKTAKNYMDTYKYGKLQLQIEFKAGSRAWGLGDLIQCANLPLFDRTQLKTLRVKEIQYATDSDIFVLEEDIGTV